MHKKFTVTIFKIYEIVVVVFLIINSTKKVKFFKKTFLIVNISLNMVLGMLFLTLSSTNIDFSKKKALMEILYHQKKFFYYHISWASRKKESTASILNLGHKNFIIYIAFLNNSSNNQKSNVYFFCKVQIAKLIANKASTLITTEYSEFINVFSLKLAFKLSKYIDINNQAIKLINK